jgi:hypothetical protein
MMPGLKTDRQNIEDWEGALRCARPPLKDT